MKMNYLPLGPNQNHGQPDSPETAIFKARPRVVSLALRNMEESAAKAAAAQRYGTHQAISEAALRASGQPKLAWSHEIKTDTSSVSASVPSPQDAVQHNYINFLTNNGQVANGQAASGQGAANQAIDNARRTVELATDPVPEPVAAYIVPEQSSISPYFANISPEQASISLEQASRISDATAAIDAYYNASANDTSRGLAA